MSFMRGTLLLSLVVLMVSCAAPSRVGFDHYAPGNLAVGSGQGLRDDTVYVPDMRFPLERAPAFLNSQVYRPGGMNGGAGGQCAASNYSFPWRDNFCETRSWDTPLCPSGKGHQGQDIRPASCTDALYWAVAAADGWVQNVGRFTATLAGTDGRIYRYLHLKMNDLAVAVGQNVRKGDRIGKVSNDFGGTPTTIHLHFEILQNIQGPGGAVIQPVPPYMSLVRAYEALTGDAAREIS